jgi:hypothetical protein
MFGATILVGNIRTFLREEMIEALFPSNGIIVGFAWEDLYQTSSGDSSFSKRGRARLRMRGFTLPNKFPVHEMIRLGGELLIWIGIRVISPFSTGRLSRVHREFAIFDNHFEIAQVREIRHNEHELGDLVFFRAVMAPRVICTYLHKEQVKIKEECFACFNHLPRWLTIIWKLLRKLLTQTRQARIIQGVQSILDSPDSLLRSWRQGNALPSGV